MSRSKLKAQGLTTSVQAPNLFAQALINGNMDVWQRGTTVVPLAKATAFAADRWYVARTIYAVGLTISRQDGTGVAGSRYALRIQRDSGNSGTEWIKAIQAIETSNTVSMRGNKWTLSFYARAGADYSPTSNNLEVGFASRTAVDEDPAVYGTIDDGTTIQLTTSWVKYTVTTSAAIVGATNTFKVIFHADPTGTASTNDYFEVTQVQLNEGESANDFQPTRYGDELLACQRYCFKLTAGGVAFKRVAPAVSNASNNVEALITMPVDLRALPTFIPSAIQYVGGAGGSNNTITVTFGWWANNVALITSTSPTTSSGFGWIFFVGTNSFLQFDAEL